MKERNGSFGSVPEKIHSAHLACLELLTSIYCVITFKSSLPKSEDYFCYLVIKRKNFPYAMSIDIHVCRRERGELPPHSPKDIHPLKTHFITMLLPCFNIS